MWGEKMKRRKILLALLLMMGIVNILLTGLYYLRFDSQQLSRIRTRNYQATIIQYEISEHIDKLDFPELTNIIITGEIKNDFCEVDYMVVYPNSYSDKELWLIGDDQYASDSSAYWAARISNGVVSEAWYAKEPLQEEEIHSYTVDEQIERVEFVTLLTDPQKFLRQPWYYDMELIGYYQSEDAASADG